MKKPFYHTFHDKHGNAIELRGDLTLEDLIRMGYTDFNLVRPETPMKENEWRHRPTDQSKP